MTITETAKPYTPAEKDRVVFKPEYARPQDLGVVYVVSKVMKVNVVLTPESGGRGVRCNPSMVIPADGAAPAATVAGISYVPPLYSGQVVQHSKFVGELFVIMRDGNNPNTYSMVKLGGDNGRYYNRVHRSFLTPVRITNITVDES